MMAATDEVREIFTDARSLHASALERLNAGDLRDAAEKAWGATKRATDALILSKRGHVPNTTGQTSRELRFLAQSDSRLQSLRTRYNTCIKELHDDCFYDGHCEPEELVVELVHSTSNYIQDAEDLAIPPEM